MNGASSTRRQIMMMLKTEGALTVGEIAERLGVTEMAVRRHINTLERDGLIATKLLRQAMGRPTNQYYLTEKSEDCFPKSYSNFTLDLLQDLEENHGLEMIEQVFRSREKRLTEEYQADFSGKSLDEKVELLAKIQDSKGYMVEVNKQEDGSYRLVEYNCPIAQVANRYNHACKCEINWFKKLLNADVERMECKAKGGQNCIYTIRARQMAKI
ncbi:transcriptional regulator [Thermoactinomyces daqus]|uniref:Transcriptional regulator n=1 Tax=Thermoactinomyces daqus TaxID=1329516 RepID=A0A7W2AHS2_9BACL|nr:metalloregulator ArsR/SmtB family transcription factor [Thermoactinomyces daqus]MBA4542113.1 transcriptional regulator [Thermoactinomyces daqus]